MFYPALTAIVTLVAMLVYFALLFNVGRFRGKNNISGTVTDIPPELAVAQRIQINTTEHVVLLLPLLWLAASLTSDAYAAIVGAVWVIGRVIYAIGYSKSFQGRLPGFLINVIAYIFLFGGVVWGLIQYYRFVAHAIPAVPAGAL